MNNRKNSILVVDNDKTIGWVLEKALSEEGYEVNVAVNGKMALEMCSVRQYSLVIMDIMMPVMDGLSALKELKKLQNPPEIIIITAHSNMENTVEAMKFGAFDYIVKPFDIDEIIELAEKAVSKYISHETNQKASEIPTSDRIIGNSAKMLELYKLLGRVASTDSSVLITGETGTGKDLFARAIHYHSARKDGPFVVVNCASIPGELLESELFGHVKGAFTGASVDRTGKCELAHEGTLFLDEIGTMRLDLQSKLLRFLQRNEFEKVGSSTTLKVNTRVIAATNSELEKLTAKGNFREDLYYRLMVVPFHIPPLRERKEDIPALAEYFAGNFNLKYGTGFKMGVSTLESLSTREWPGNIRELENFVHRMVVLQSETPESKSVNSYGVPGKTGVQDIDTIVSELIENTEENLLESARERIEKPLLAKILSRHKYNQSETARVLGISRSTLRSMLAKYKLS